jgi:hypothetical protein
MIRKSGNRFSDKIMVHQRKTRAASSRKIGVAGRCNRRITNPRRDKK